MTHAAWKRTETALAHRLGGRRVPVTGRQRGDVPDIDHRRLSVEVKERRTLPAWLLTAVAQARAAAKPGQIPVAILHRAGDRHVEDLVVMRLGDFIEHIGPGLTGDITPEDALSANRSDHPVNQTGRRA